MKSYMTLMPQFLMTELCLQQSYGNLSLREDWALPQLEQLQKTGAHHEDWNAQIHWDKEPCYQTPHEAIPQKDQPAIKINKYITYIHTWLYNYRWHLSCSRQPIQNWLFQYSISFTIIILLEVIEYIIMGYVQTNLA